MKVITHSLTVAEDINMVHIDVFSDLHIGSKKCNLQDIKARVKRVAETPNMYAMINGDIINNSIKESVGDTYQEPLSPMEQIKLAVSIFEPIKDKILAVVSGNHERRSYKHGGVDLIYFLCSELGIQDRYDYVSTFTFLKLLQEGNTRPLLYTIYMTHGDGNGGRTIGGKMNGLHRRSEIIPECDVFITGHTHMPATFKDAYYRIDRHNQNITRHERTYMNCAATLDYEEYAELFGMPPSSQTHPLLSLGVHTNTAKVVL